MTVNELGWTVLHNVACFGDLRTVGIFTRFGLMGLNTETKDKKGRKARQVLDQRTVVPTGFVEAFDGLLQSIREADGEESELFVDALEAPVT